MLKWGSSPGSVAVEGLGWGPLIGGPGITEVELPEMLRSEGQGAAEVRECYEPRREGLQGGWKEVGVAGRAAGRGPSPCTWRQGH